MPFALELRRWMSELEINDAQLANAFVAKGDYGLFGSISKRIGEWRRGQSTPQNLARVRHLEVSISDLAKARGVTIPDTLLSNAWQEQRSRKPTVRPLHTTARTISLSGQSGDGVRLAGVVSGKIRGRGGVVFFDVLDPNTMRLAQFGAQREALKSDVFESVKSLRDGMRIKVEGRLGANRSGDLVAWVTQAPTTQEPIANLSLATAAPEQKRVAASLVTATIRYAVQDHLSRSGFFGVATRILSSSINSTDGLNALTASYPGFGTPVTIAPSPSPQLIDAIIVSGAEKVFASSPCFTTSYRDDLDGVETDLVMAKVVGGDLGEMFQIIEELLKVVSDQLGLSQSDQKMARQFATWPQLDCSGVDFPEVVIARLPETEGAAETTVFRVHLTRTCAPIEGAVEPFTSETTVGTVSIFPSRFLPMVERTPIRRLHPLGMGPDVPRTV